MIYLNSYKFKKNENLSGNIVPVSVKWINARILSGSLIFLVSALSASSQNKLENNTSLPPVETQAPISNGQEPAFRGQTRIGGVKTQTKVKLISIASGLHFMGSHYSAGWSGHCLGKAR